MYFYGSYGRKYLIPYVSRLTSSRDLFFFAGTPVIFTGEIPAKPIKKTPENRLFFTNSRKI
jgi:hypothetical protein